MMAKDLHIQHVLLQLLAPRECVGVAPGYHTCGVATKVGTARRPGAARGRTEWPSPKEQFHRSNALIIASRGFRHSVKVAVPLLPPSYTSPPQLYTRYVSHIHPHHAEFQRRQTPYGHFLPGGVLMGQ